MRWDCCRKETNMSQGSLLDNSNTLSFFGALLTTIPTQGNEKSLICEVHQCNITTIRQVQHRVLHFRVSTFITSEIQFNEVVLNVTSDES